MQEIMRFMKADAPCDTSRPLRYSVLLDPAILPEVSSAESGKSLRLQDAILASYYHNEVVARILGCFEFTYTSAQLRFSPWSCPLT